MFDFIRNLFGRANAQPAGKDAARKPAQGSGSGQSRKAAGQPEPERREQFGRKPKAVYRPATAKGGKKRRRR